MERVGTEAQRHEGTEGKPRQSRRRGGFRCCRRCGGDMHVSDSRWQSRGVWIRRRRVCAQCGLRRTSYEIELTVVGAAAAIRAAREVDAQVVGYDPIELGA